MTPEHRHALDTLLKAFRLRIDQNPGCECRVTIAYDSLSAALAEVDRLQARVLELEAKNKRLSNQLDPAAWLDE